MKPVLATATWCGPCKVLKNQLESLNLLDKVDVKDVDVERTFFNENKIKSVPTLVVLREGQESLKYSGTDNILSIIKEL